MLSRIPENRKVHFSMNYRCQSRTFNLIQLQLFVVVVFFQAVERQLVHFFFADVDVAFDWSLNDCSILKFSSFESVKFVQVFGFPSHLFLNV